MSHTPGEIISAETIKEVERWEVPSMGTQFTMHEVQRDKLYSIEREAYDAGFERGHKEGLDKANQEAQQQLKDQGKLLNQYIASLKKPLSRLDEQVEQVIAELISSIVTRLIDQQCQTDQSLLERHVKQALSQLLQHDDQAILTVHSNDKAQAEQLKTSLITTDIIIKVDDDVGHGHCRLSTADAVIDMSIRTRVEQLVANLFTEV